VCRPRYVVGVLSVKTFSIAAILTAATQLPAGPAASLLEPGHLIYHDGLRRLLMLGAYQVPDMPELTPLWEWDNGKWTLLPVMGAPPMRTLGAAVYDSRRDRIVMHGGLGRAGLDDPRGDTWEWDGRRWMQMRDATTGSRDHHSMAYDEGRGRTVMYGGVSSTGDPPAKRAAPTDTWEWDGRWWTRIVTPGPDARSGAGMVYDRARKCTVLFGGVGGSSGNAVRFGDTWTWDGATWTKVAEEGPAGRNGHAMVFDPRSGDVLMWGGTVGGAHLDDLWRWDGRRWTEVAAGGLEPGKRTGAEMAYDAARNLVVLYGGRIRENGVVRPSAEMWEWHGNRWKQAH
jgi:hypothetical protein